MYYSDKPIESSENDLLGRSQFSKHLAQSLLKLNSSESFTVGINGKFVLWNKDEEVDADERVPLSQVRELLDIWENTKG